jgi:hypothetical protein
MSVHLCVFLCESDLPTQEQWQRAVRNAGHDLVFDDFSPREHAGFLPVQSAGEECGFEYSFNSIDDHDVEEMLAVIGNRTHAVTFTWHSSMQDLHAAQIAASVLTDMANGVFFDPQSGTHAEGKAVYLLLANERNAERERKLAEAERKWAKVTERRCPECNARCPEYRGSCWVCGFAVGKLPA